MKRALICAALLVMLSGCSQAEPHSLTLFAMDTVMELTVYGEESLLDEAQAIITEGEQRLSVTESDSEIAALNREGACPISPETEKLLRQAQALCAQTGGALDISVYPVVRAWGFTTGEYRVPSDEELAGLLPLVDHQKLQIEEGRAALSPGMQIDLGSVAKGWIGDKVLELFRQKGVKSALLNLGGNVQALGAKPDGSPWRVAVRDPAREDYAGALEVTDKVVVTSGGYQRYFEEGGQVYHHIIDPATGRPANSELLSVTIVDGSGFTCDGLSTALFVMGLEKATDLWRANGGFEAVFLTSDSAIITEGLADCFTPMGNYANREVTVLHHD